MPADKEGRMVEELLLETDERDHITPYTCQQTTWGVHQAEDPWGGQVPVGTPSLPDTAGGGEAARGPHARGRPRAGIPRYPGTRADDTINISHPSAAKVFTLHRNWLGHFYIVTDSGDVTRSV